MNVWRASADSHTSTPCLRAHVCARPGLVWGALTDADKTGAYLHGLATRSTWIAGAPISFRLGDRTELTGRVLHAQCPERLSYLLQFGPHDPPTYLTWLIRPAPGGCTIRLEIDEVDNADSREDAEDVWRPVLAALQPPGESGLTWPQPKASLGTVQDYVPAPLLEGADRQH